MTDTLVEWSEELATGILWQDFQHAGLIARINFLHRAIVEKRAQAELELMIDFLDNYTENHFSMEERYMEALNDPSLRTHARAHRQFRDSISELKQFGETESQLTAASLCYDLHAWVRNHIRTIDKGLGSLLQKNALK